MRAIVFLTLCLYSLVGKLPNNRNQYGSSEAIFILLEHHDSFHIGYPISNIEWITN